MTSNRSTCSPAASPAAESQAPESGRDSAIPKLRFGGSSFDSFAYFDPDTSSWKTSQLSLLSEGEGASPKSSPDWPRAGTSAGGTCYQRQPLAPRTSASGSSLLGTPTARDGRSDGSQNVPSRKGRGSSLMKSLLPTPASADGERQSITYARGNPTLKGGLLPTPQRQWDARNETANRSNPDSPHASGTTPADFAVKHEAASGATTPQPFTDGKQSSAGQRLSPWFVEWMMGAPPGFTDPDCQLSAMEFKSKWGSSWGE